MQVIIGSAVLKCNQILIRTELLDLNYSGAKLSHLSTTSLETGLNEDTTDLRRKRKFPFLILSTGITGKWERTWRSSGTGMGMGVGRREWKRMEIIDPSLQISYPNVTVGDRDEDTKTLLTW